MNRSYVLVKGLAKVKTSDLGRGYADIVSFEMKPEQYNNRDLSKEDDFINLIRKELKIQSKKYIPLGYYLYVYLINEEDIYNYSVKLLERYELDDFNEEDRKNVLPYYNGRW